MAKRWFAFIALSFLVSFSFAKDKKKTTLPDYILQAHTVTVIVDPSTRFSLDDPHANFMAQKDVEAALLKWGRFQPVSEDQSPDLIVVVHKGTGRMMDDMGPDSRPNIGNGGNGGNGSITSPHGAQPNLPSEGIGQQGSGSPMYTPDFFAVFKGGENPRTAIPAWKYPGQDGLSPASVPAVMAFRKAVDAAEKTAAEKP